jgi:hypothetical protein
MYQEPVNGELEHRSMEVIETVEIETVQIETAQIGTVEIESVEIETHAFDVSGATERGTRTQEH